VAAWLLFAADQRSKELARLLLGEFVAATLASFVCTPLTQIVDVAVSMGASGSTTVSKAMASYSAEWVTSPLHQLQ
jgi:hypothetical protein